MLTQITQIVPDNYTYARVAAFIKNRNTLSDASLEGLKEITLDEEMARAVIEASKVSS